MYYVNNLSVACMSSKNTSSPLTELRNRVIMIMLVTTNVVLWPATVAIFIGREYIMQAIQAGYPALQWGILITAIIDLAILLHFRKTKDQRLAVIIIILFYFAAVTFLANDPNGSSINTYLLMSALIVVFSTILYGRLQMAIVLTICGITLLFIRVFQVGLGLALSDLSYITIVFVIGVFIDLSMGKLVQTLDDLDNTKRIVEENLIQLKKQSQREKAITQRLDLVVSNISEAVILVDTHLNIKLINRLGRNYLNTTVNSKLDLTKFIDERDGSHVDVLKDVLDKGKTYKFEEHLALRVGTNEKKAVEAWVTPVWVDSNIKFALIIIRDVTESRELDNLKSEFVSIASHQMRTPLTAIKWNLENLSERILPDDSISQEIIQTSQESTIRMVELVNDLLNTSRISRGDLKELQKKNFGFINMINEVVKVNQQKMDAKGITLSLDLPETEVEFYGDDEKLFEVFSNLLSNATKYSPENTTVSLSVRNNSDNILVEVSDQGMGIPESEQSQIFQKFYRASNARKEIMEGNGLGLYVVKSFVEAHGGMISFASVLGKGTTFYVKLPN